MICAACGHGLQKTELARAECNVLKDALERHQYNMKHASDELKISLSTMKRKVLRHGLREKGKPMPGWKGGHPRPAQVTAAEAYEPS